MHAWTWNGDPESSALRLEELSLPAPQPGEVLVANKAVALNPIDWKILGRKSGWEHGHIPGVDGAGIVVACGEDVVIPTGTRVAYHQDLQRHGSFATHTVVAVKALLPLPEAIRFMDAATVPCPGLTAWMAIDKLPHRVGRDVLVVGAGSAVGTFLVQIALRRGYRVWTTASAQHHAQLLEKGAAGVFDYHDAEWREALLHALGEQHLFAAVDTVNEEHARSLVPLIGYNGHVVCIQGRLNSPASPPVSTVVSQHEVALGAIYRHGNVQDWDDLRGAGAALLQDIAEGNIAPPAICRFEFAHLAEALASLQAGSSNGKLVCEL
ncbi:zinc-binding dehydrogenase [Terriglobus tenax]|uniref:zinc-binding dehydrogenase n=1 Tax=Terriglobus tenax TaxID=1111115 RepID=UPI0021DFBD6F|nr:zinc-binding dehydrogenase [Terriglobus tenax]